VRPRGIDRRTDADAVDPKAMTEWRRAFKALAAVRQMWNAAGLSATTASLLWSVSVFAEVIVFVGIGPWHLDLTSLAAFLGPQRLLASAAPSGQG
jgi:hypothetical protein